jgi:hypothetical protein
VLFDTINHIELNFGYKNKTLASFFRQTMPKYYTLRTNEGKEFTLESDLLADFKTLVIMFDALGGLDDLDEVYGKKVEEEDLDEKDHAAAMAKSKQEILSVPVSDDTMNRLLVWAEHNRCKKRRAARRGVDIASSEKVAAAIVVASDLIEEIDEADPDGEVDEAEIAEQKWISNFMDVDPAVMLKLITAANYFEIDGLMEASCIKVSEVVNGKGGKELERVFMNSRK